MNKAAIVAIMMGIVGLSGCSKPPKSEEAAKGVDTSVSPSSAAAPASEPEQATVVTDADVEARYSATYGTCMSSGDAAEGITSAMADCIGAEIDAQDLKLNTTYKSVMQSLDEAKRPALRQAQRDWIKFRDSKCASEAQSGGSMDVLNSGGCILNATVRRTMELEAIAEAE